MKFDPKKKKEPKLCACGCKKPIEEGRDFAKYRVRCGIKRSIAIREKYRIERRKKFKRHYTEPRFNGKTFGWRQYDRFMRDYFTSMNKPYDNNLKVSVCVPYWEKQGKPNKI